MNYWRTLPHAKPAVSDLRFGSQRLRIPEPEWYCTTWRKVCMGRRDAELARKLQLVLVVENAGSNTGTRVGVWISGSGSPTSLICADGVCFAWRRFLRRMLQKNSIKDSMQLTWLYLGVPSPAPIPYDWHRWFVLEAFALLEGDSYGVYCRRMMSKILCNSPGWPSASLLLLQSLMSDNNHRWIEDWWVEKDTYFW